MKQLQKSDLKLGEIYWFVGSTIKFLNKISSINIDEYDCFLYNTTYSAEKGKNLSIPVNILEATPEEKHWLETCIKADQFVPYEEAMKTFIPEYVEVLDNGCAINNNVIIGKIYKTYKNFSHIYDICILLDNKYRIGFYRDQLKRYLKPSTKEAYDAQFKEPEKEKPKVVLEKPKDKVLAHFIQSDITLIHSVECSEGGVYRIGDKITVFDKYSPNKGKVFTIKSFRWSNDKSKICAVTELHTPNGIGLDKIELYVEPKVKVKDEFVLPEKWCVKVNSENQNFISSVRDRSCSFTFITSDLILPDVKNSWWCNMEAKSKGFTEITLEQFKQYVLKNE